MRTTRLIASFGRVPWLSRIVRWYAGQYPENSLVKIRHGQASGLWWRRHHRYVHGYWIGHYELPIQEALQRELRPDDTFFDVGAHAGFLMLVAARQVGSNGRCVAFEPAPENCASIREQIEANDLHYCSAVDEAISNFVGTAFFSSPTAGSSMARLGQCNHGERQLRVKVTTLDCACRRFGKPDFIKMDIEGAEIQALKAAENLLENLRPGWLIELHGPECERGVKALLIKARYDFFDLRGVALNPARVLPHHFVARPVERGGA